MQVVAAVIEREGKILIGQRKRSGRHPLKWEFPGGKVEPGEDPRAALERELREELGVEARAGQMLDQYEVRYGDGPPTELHFYRVTEFSGEPRNLDFEQIVWERPERLAEYDFLDGDFRFIEDLTNRRAAEAAEAREPR
jgi:mutator protein MutT